MSKYTRTIKGVEIDIYDILDAYQTGSAAVDHAIKKLLCPGTRGAKSRMQDLDEARNSLDRAIQIELAKGATA